MIVQSTDIQEVIFCSPCKRGEQKDFILNRDYWWMQIRQAMLDLFSFFLNPSNSRELKNKFLWQR